VAAPAAAPVQGWRVSHTANGGADGRDRIGHRGALGVGRCGVEITGAGFFAAGSAFFFSGGAGGVGACA
jgi:hypothetical protein